MNLWLDDVRNPAEFGYIGWTWVKTAEEAIKLFQTGGVTRASLDHDLSIAATLGYPDKEDTGYTVVCWLEEHNMWPPGGVSVHSMNPVGAERMRRVINKAYEGSRGWTPLKDKHST